MTKSQLLLYKYATYKTENHEPKSFTFRALQALTDRTFP